MFLIYLKNDTQLEVLKVLEGLSNHGDIDCKFTTHTGGNGDMFSILVVRNSNINRELLDDVITGTMQENKKKLVVLDTTSDMVNSYNLASLVTDNEFALALECGLEIDNKLKITASDTGLLLKHKSSGDLVVPSDDLCISLIVNHTDLDRYEASILISTYYDYYI
jgi:hypothetical protein